MTYIKIVNLSFQYSNSKVFNFADISIEEKESWLITGNSGSGKTTLLHLIAGILKPSTGTITVENKSIGTLKATQLDIFRAKHIGLVFQKNYFIDALSMHKNLTYFAKLSGQKADSTYLNQLLNDLEVAQLAIKKPSQLSSGELQRFSIARGLINKPGVIIADEPTSNLDDDNCMRFTKLLVNICNAYEATLLIATHDARLKGEFKNTIRLN